MLSRGNRIRRWREHGNSVSSQMIAKEREYVAVMSVGFPGVVLYHVVCPKLCCALPEASHLTHSWPGIINRHFALLSKESDCRSSAFSEVLTERLFVVHWVAECPSGDTMYSHPSSRSVLPVVSRFIARVCHLSIRSIQRFSVGAINFWWWSDAEAIHECILFCSELSHAARWIAHSSELMRGWISAGILCPCSPKLVEGRIKCGDCSLVTAARTDSFSKN